MTGRRITRAAADAAAAGPSAAPATDKPIRRPRRTKEQLERDAAEDEVIRIDNIKMNVDLRKALHELGDNYQERVIGPAAEAHMRIVSSLKEQVGGGIHPEVPQVSIHDGWSQQDENNVLAEWETEKSQWVDIHDRKRYLGLWKICLQFGNCTPWDIVGVKNKLTFELDLRADPEERNENHTWSTDFIQRLTSLVTHPAWCGSRSTSRAELLGAAIQYAVILRTNDQRVWDTSSMGGGFFELFHLLGKQLAPCPVEQVHAQVRQGLNRWGDPTLPVISHVLKSMEDLIQGPSEPLVSSDDVYNVTTVDLANIVKAVDQTVDPDTRIMMFMPTEVIYNSVKAARGARSFPSMEQLDKYHYLALIEEKRRKVVASRLSMPPDGGDDEVEDEGEEEDDDLPPPEE